MPPLPAPLRRTGFFWRIILLHLRTQSLEPRPRYLRWIAAAFATAFVAGAGAGLLQEAPSVPLEVPVVPLSTDLASSAAAEQPLAAHPTANAVVMRPPILGQLSPGETLAESLQIRGISPDRIHLITTEMAPVLDFRYAKPGDHYRLTLASDGSVDNFLYERSLTESYELTREGADHYSTKAHRPELIRRRARIAGVVTSSLYGAIEQLGEDRELAEDFAEIFAWDVDFSRGVHRGDEFSILYERLYTKDAQGHEVYARPGQILAARYTSDNDDHRAVYFEPLEGHGAYYRPDGEPMERQFLKAPLDYKRISSEYTNARLHPILGIWRPHHGIDYAAPYGTPVWSVGSGEVMFKGYQNGFGNLVKVRHVNGIVSYYAHLSRFAPTLRIGQKVNQKQVIGYVGATGLATGPHLCFRLAKEGEYVNPATLHAAGGDVIPTQARARFASQTGDLLAALDPRPLVTTNEAL